MDNKSDKNYEDQLRSIKEDVDALQSHLLSKKTPFYRQATTLVAFLALLFSFGTTVVSYYRVAEQDRRASLIELRGLIQDIGSFPKQDADNNLKFKGNQTVLTALSANLNSQNMVLAKEAAAIIRNVPNRVLAIEYSAVGTALSKSGLIKEAFFFHEEAAKRADNPIAATGAYRTLAGFAVAEKDGETARKYMKKAREIFERFPLATQYVKDQTNTETEIQSARMELDLGEYDRAKEHIEKAIELHKRLQPAWPLTLQSKAQIEQIKLNLSLIEQSK
jgi:tetratricopeptide (TPR) repeat protein